MSIEVVRTKRGEHRYKVRLRDPAGTRVHQTIPHEMEAEAFEVTERTDRARGVWDSRGRRYVRVEHWARDWLVADPADEPIDRVCRRVIVERYINPSIGLLRLNEVTPREIRLLFDEWRMTLGDTYAELPYAVLRAIFASARDAGLIKRSPCR